MRTTININDELFAKAQEYTGIKQKTKLIETALKKLLAEQSAKRLIMLGGTDSKASVTRRNPWS